MTGRLALQAKLDAAVELRAMTLLQGLPRVGRSRLITDWMKRRPDAARCVDPTAGTGSDSIVVFDQFDQANVAALIAAVRATDAAGGRTRYVVAPNDLATSFAIRDKLAGVFQTIEVTPLRLDEFDDGFTTLSAAMGPLVAVPAAPTPQLQSNPDPLRHWLRGGFPESLEAASDQASLAWRRQLLEPLLEREYTRWELPAAFPLEELLRWLAQRNSAELDENVNKFGRRADLKSGIHVLGRLGLVRRLPNVAAVDNPEAELKDKLFVRDTGLLHAMLGIVTRDQLVQHKAIGASFESYAIESLISAAGTESGAHFYRFDNGQGDDEIDLILDFPAQVGRQIAIECKVGPNKRAEPGFFRACGLMGITEQLVVHSGPDPYLDEKVPRLDLRSAIRRITTISAGG